MVTPDSRATPVLPSRDAEAAATVRAPYRKDRSGFAAVLRRHISSRALATAGTVLALGASAEDGEVLQAAGFGDVTLSNLGGGIEWNRVADAPFRVVKLDVEAIDLPDQSYDVVFAHEVLHHCRSPHRALCEMLRVARKHVVFMEPNDSWLMRLLVPLGIRLPFELAVVVHQDYVSGGVRNSNIPNFIYRWNQNELQQTVFSFLAEEVVRVHAFPYWELNANECDLELRKDTNLGLLVRCLGGPKNYIRMQRVAGWLLNLLPPIRKQGNKFFCCIERTHELRPWLKRENGEIVFNRQYQGH